MRQTFISLAAALLFAAISAFAMQARAQAPGAEVCQNCHEDNVKHFQSSVHGQKVAKTPGGAGGCAVCHGDATEHVKAGGGKGVGIKNPGSKAANADDTNELCMGCHKAGSKRTHWDTSTHRERGNSCASCHTMHQPDKVLAKQTQPEVCFTCHKQQRVEVMRTYRHPIMEGKVTCSDCHNPHGSIGRALMKRDSVVETCFQCHAEKRGPFVHPHDPVTEDCALCHNPHGTVTESMLKIRPPFLCHSCHSPHGALIPSLRGQPGTPAVGTALSGKGGSNSTQGFGCRNCHTQVHGSNNPSAVPPTPQFQLR